MRTHRTFHQVRREPEAVRVFVPYGFDLETLSTSSVAVCNPKEPASRRCLWELSGVIDAVPEFRESEFFAPKGGRAFLLLRAENVFLINENGTRVWPREYQDD